MKLSPVTLKILEYNSRLSNYIYFNIENKGYIIFVNESKDLYCFYFLNEKEKLINDFVLYHYDEILEMMKTLDYNQLEFEFKQEELVLKDLKTVFTFRYARKEVLPLNEKILNIPDVSEWNNPDISLIVEGKELYKLNKILKAMKMDEFVMKFDNNKLMIGSVNSTKIKKFEKEITISDLKVVNPVETKMTLLHNGLNDLNFSFDYKLNFNKKFSYIYLQAIINTKKDEKVVKKPIPFYCILRIKKVTK